MLYTAQANQQNNTLDCGIFAMARLRVLTFDDPRFAITQDQAPLFRKHFLLELKRGTVHIAELDAAENPSLATANGDPPSTITVKAPALPPKKLSNSQEKPFPFDLADDPPEIDPAKVHLLTRLQDHPSGPPPSTLPPICPYCDEQTIPTFPSQNLMELWRKCWARSKPDPTDKYPTIASSTLSLGMVCSIFRSAEHTASSTKQNLVTTPDMRSHWISISFTRALLHYNHGFNNCFTTIKRTSFISGIDQL
jgi:hypothetical protein